MFSLVNKLCFVTGGANGIGRSVGQRYSDAGARVVLADLADGRAVAEQMGAHFVSLDVSNDAAVAAVLQSVTAEHGALDVLVNNAGIVSNENWFDIVDGTPDNLRRIFEVNTFGVFYGIKHGALALRDGGSIINTSSLAASMGVPGNSQYSGTKAAVDQISHVAALELGERGIRVNTICPAFVATDMGGSDLGTNLANTVTALGRIGEVDDLVGLYHFLAADESRWITGQSFNVDGGWSAGLSRQAMARLGQVSDSPA